MGRRPPCCKHQITGVQCQHHICNVGTVQGRAGVIGRFSHAVCLIVVLPPAVGDLFLLPLMWYWVGGGWSALFGTASCLASIFLIMDPEVIEKRPWVRTYTAAIHVSTPLAYTLLARWTGWIGQTLWVIFTVWRIWRILRRTPSKQEIPPGETITHKSFPVALQSKCQPGQWNCLQEASGYLLACCGLLCTAKVTSSSVFHGLICNASNL